MVWTQAVLVSRLGLRATMERLLTEKVLAYEDYECSSLVGSVPVSGKCVAATRAKIGSWQAQCNSTDSSQVATAATSYASGELKRRGKYRLPAVRDEADRTSYTTGPIATASSIVSEFSSAISESATATDAEVTPSPSAGAAFSSAVNSGADIGYNLTSYLTDTASQATTTAGENAIGTPSMTTTSAPAVITYSGDTHANGSVTFQRGAAATNQIGNGKVLTTILASMLVILGAAVAL